MRRKVVAAALSIIMLFSNSSLALAAENADYVQIASPDYKGRNFGLDFSRIAEGVSGKSRTAYYLNMDDLFGELAAGEVSLYPSGPSVVDTSKEMTVILKVSGSNPSQINGNITKKLLIDDAPDISLSEEEDENSVYKVMTPDLTIKVGYQIRSGLEHSVTFQEGLEVGNGTKLLLDNDETNGDESRINYTFSKPVTVSGTLEFDGNTSGLGYDGGIGGYVTFTDGANLLVKGGGNVIVGGVGIEGDTASPLFQVEEGGTLDFTSAGVNSYSTIETSGTAIQVDGGAVNIDAGKITTGAEEPAIVVNGGNVTIDEYVRQDKKVLVPEISSNDVSPITVNTGATLTLSGGKVNNTSNNPAITVEEGATVTIPEDSTASITTGDGNTNGQAIDLAGGAKVTQGNETFTVAPSGEGDVANYVDNFGNIVLASGGTKTAAGSDSSAIPGNTVITPNGMTVTGNDTVPTVDETTGAVSVPESGGTITNSMNETIEVENGGEIPSVVFKVGEALQQSATIKTDNTFTLIPHAFDTTIDLETYDCTWKSDKTKIATVTDGTVTGVAPGKARITAEFTPKSSENGETVLVEDTDVPAGTLTADFEVTVEKSSSGGGGPTIPYYSITVPAETEEGKVTVSPTVAKQGDTVTVTVEPKEGYDLKELTAIDRSGAAVELTRTEDGRYTFKMPGSGVEIKASFEVSDPTAGLLDQEIVIRKAQVRDLADRTLNDKNTRVKFLVAPKTDVTYESSNDQVVTVDEEGYIRYTGLGEATITVRAEQTEEYKAAEVILTVKVGLKQPTFTPSSRDNGFTVTSSTVKGAKKFQVQYVLQGRSFKHDSARSKTFTVDDKLRKGKVSAANKKIYRIRVRAISGDFKSEWSPVKTIPTK